MLNAAQIQCFCDDAMDVILPSYDVCVFYEATRRFKANHKNIYDEKLSTILIRKGIYKRHDRSDDQELVLGCWVVACHLI